MRCFPRAFLLLLFAEFLASRSVGAQAVEGPAGSYDPPLAAASDEPSRAVARMRVPEGLTVTPFAAEPLLAHPVAFAIDPKGRVYVAETFRHSDGVTATRGHMNWLDADLACRTVPDRVAMYRAFSTPEEFAGYGKEHDRLRLVEDRDGDGTADHATVFADGFNRPETGIGAGVLPLGDAVLYTCIPDLWKLRDADRDGRADERTSLASGFGVHVGFLGHDLHGLIQGPDGRIYFSIGDRGLNVTTLDGRRIVLPDTGAVLRCEPDGTQLEVVHTGLRNPQELAFDDEGNLFTVDNNSDSGDRARLVYVVPGGDSGWRIGWQFIEQPTPRGPWNAERMWETQNDAQPAFLVPPLANLSDGPSGLAYHPGTALVGMHSGRFFLADFRGSADISGVRSFAVRSKGAAFEVVNQEEFLWGLEATDVAFGPDGALYVSDWVEGWSKTGKGRIYKVSAPPLDHQSAEPVGMLLSEGMAGRTVKDLARLLDHDDMRIRQAAQFELAARARVQIETGANRNAGEHDALWALSAGAGIPQVRGGLQPITPLRVKRHSLWGLAQVYRGRRLPGRVFAGYGLAGEPEIRALAARIVADHVTSGRDAANSADLFLPAPDNQKPILDMLIALVARDPEPKVRFHAAVALGALGDPDAIGALCQILEANADRDPYLRHAGVMGLAGIRDENKLRAVAVGASVPVRMGVLLALRKNGSPSVAGFLSDPEPRIVLETARAINDIPITAVMANLARLGLGPNPPAPLARRVINANVHTGGDDAAERLVALATREDVAETLRIEALEALAGWAKPPGRDRVTGLWRPIPERAKEPAATSLARRAGELLDVAPDAVQRATVGAVAALDIAGTIPSLVSLVAATERSAATRVEALRALDTLKAPELAGIVAHAVEDREPTVRAEALRLLAAADPARALPVIARILETGPIGERQEALATLAGLAAAEADQLLARWLDQLIAGSVPAELHLDLIEAARRREDAGVRERLDRFEASRKTDDPLASHRLALVGGDARRGAAVFFGKAEVECVRCHKVGGYGGEVGPSLSGLGGKKGRDYLLESIVLPNRAIAEGFGTRVLALDDGTTVTGVIKGESERAITLVTAEGRTIEVDRSQVEAEQGGDSAMPGDLVEKLTPRELRDLLEFLANAG